jgi:hypothetical protein
MRFTKNELHPVIFERMKEFASSAYMTNGMTPEQYKVYNKHSGVWFKEYWRGLSLWVAGIPLGIGATALAKQYMTKGAAALVFFACLAIWCAVGAMGYAKTQGEATLGELEALRPGLKLSETEGLYLDCFIAVQKCELLDAEQRRAWCDALREAMNRSIQLQELEEELRQLSGGKGSHEVQEEIHRLEGLVASTEDSVAKQTYQESLEIVRARSTKAESALVQIERTEAHLELTRQTFIRTREMIRSLQVNQQQVTRVDLDPLRANLDRVQTDAKLIVDAIEELNQS